LLRTETFEEMIVHDAEPTGRIARRDGAWAFDRITCVMFHRHEFDLRISGS
jgi:hypothetical protein